LNTLNNLALFKSELGIKETTLLLVSRKQPITREWRFFVYKNQVITGSLYLVGEERIDETIRDGYLVSYLSEVLKNVDWYPDTLYTADVCESQGELHLLELGSYSCAGEYGCDFRLLIEAGAKAAWEDYEAVNI
jgi:ATP-grasp domain, R2K clade family 3